MQSFHLFSAAVLFVNSHALAFIIEGCVFLQLQHNNVDMALEWLLSNPEEPTEDEPAQPAEAPAAEIAHSFPKAGEQEQASTSKGQASLSAPLSL